MTDIAIKVENLSKRYRIGLKEELPDTFVGALTSWLKAPFQNFRDLRRLTTFDEGRRTAKRDELHSPNGHSSSVIGHSSPDDIIWALKDVSFEVKQGEVVGIIGRNGAGKSTLLKILSRITEPTSGRAIINGRVSSLLEVGTGFHPELTGRENVYLNGTVLGMSKAEIDRKFDEIVDFAEVEKFIDTPVKRYSSGMQVRLGFAVAAHLDPEILIVDEVLSVGDAAFRKKCLTYMQNESEQSGCTVLLVSHHMAHIRRLCQNVIWIDGGKIRQIGEAMDVSLTYETKIIDQGIENNSGIFIRSGSHHPDVWISRVEMKDANGNLCTKFKYGEDICLNIHISFGRNYKSHGIGRVALVWHLSDERDVRISSDATIYHGIDFGPDVNIVYSQLHTIPLYKGTYKLELGITQETMGRIDTWKDGVVFNVIYSDPKGQGYEFDRRSGYVNLENSWQVF